MTERRHDDEGPARNAAGEAERLRRTFDSVTEFAVVVTDRRGIVTEWNTGAERTLGWSAAEIVGQSAEVFFTPEDREAGQVQREMAASLTTGRGIDERWHLRKDGGRFWASGEMMPVRDDDERHVGFVKVLRDRTEQHLAGIRLRMLETHLQQAQDAGGVGLFTVEIATGLLTATPSMSRLFGLEHRERRPAEDFEEQVIEADRAIVSSNSTRRGGSSRTNVEYRIRRADDGQERWIARRGEFQFDGGSEPVRFAGVVRDVTETKVAQLRLANSEAKWRGLFENLQEGFVLGRVVRDAAGCVVDWAYEEVNRAWGDLVGIDPASVIGRTVRETIPGIEDEWIEEFANVVETGEPVRFTRQVGALDRWYDGVAQPVGCDNFVVVFLEVTDRVRAERRRDALLRLGDRLREITDPAALALAACEGLARSLDTGLTGYGDVDPVAETITIERDFTAPGVPSLAGTLRFRDFGDFIDDLKRDEAVVIRDCETDPRTKGSAEALKAIHARAFVSMPIFERGRFVALFYVGTDRPRNWTAEELDFVRDVADRVRLATERLRADRLLRASEERQRLALEIGEIGTFDLDVSTGRLTLDARARAAFGVNDGRSVTQAQKLGAVHPDDRAAFEAMFRLAAEGGMFDLQFRTIGIDDNQTRWVNVRGRVMDSGRFVGAVRDVTDRVAADERRTVLNRELSHRLKNTLAIVQSIATQTLRTAPDLAAARQTLTDRIQTLSKAHDILLTGQRDAAPIAEIVRAATALHDAGGHVDAAGPDIRLGPKASLTLALILHELSTNAGKYGALSTEAGRVSVSWSAATDADTGRPMLRFDWREAGGPPVVAPTRRSFGTRLIEMGLSGATESRAELVYAPDGLRCRLVAALTELQSQEE